MRSENESPTLYIYSYEKFTLQLCEVFRNASRAQNATALYTIV
jgi:hypothetical protein